MEQEVNFKADLGHYLRMAIEVWPTVKSAMKHLSQVGEPSQESFLPRRNYSSMEQSQFTKVVAEDLLDFIMTHDVKAEDVEDYLDDVLDLLMVQEQLTGGNSNPASTYYMSNYTIEVIEELQKGKKDKVRHFQEFIYNQVRLFKGQVIESNNDNDDGQSCSEEEDYSDQSEQEQQQKPEKVEKSEQQLQREQQLEDDGWTIVRK